ncbi:MAG: hypothetical protein Q8M15_07100 [Bacteroidota bacterium]|nr:hypothetical protein [Bacteroidota bacterium]
MSSILKYIIRKSHICLFFKHQTKTFKRSTGIKIQDPKHFNPKDFSFSQKHPNWVNDTKHVREFYNQVSDLILEARKLNTNRVIYANAKLDELNRGLKFSHEERGAHIGLYDTLLKYTINDPAYAEAKVNGNKNKVSDFHSILAFVRDYQIHKKVKITLGDLNKTFLKTMFDFAATPHSSHYGKYEFQDQWKTKIKDGKKAPDTLNDFWGILKGVFKRLDNEFGFALNKSIYEYKPPTESTKTPIYLFHEEFKTLYNHHPDIKENEMLLDFIFASLGTGLNFEDLNKVGENNIVRYAGFYRIELKRNKSRMACKIPLTEKVYDIFKKYDFNLHFYTNTQFNSAFRKLMSSYPIFHELDFIYAEENGLEMPEKRYEILSHENFRKTFITYCFDLGIQENHIWNRVGHRDGENMKHYHDNDERYLTDEIRKLIKEIIYVKN